ncbi:MAG: glutamate--tRNA ligase [Vicinamibacterales bacterium]
MRVRFAPSPTGQLHVGNARTALFNWFLARGRGGEFILRIEDTDVERSTIESEAAIVRDLRWLGLDWDEGPDIGGARGPYRQSERLHLYQSYAQELLTIGKAYRCFCTKEQLEARRAAAMDADGFAGYDGACRRLSVADVDTRLARGEKAAIRFRIPENRDVGFTDAVRGEVRFHTSVIGDPVIMRAEGVPAYNFAVVVDDALMGVTQVIRGEDHISNTPRQILLYEAMGFTPPAFAHLSLVMGPDHAPLSKRHGATSVAEFRTKGYLPEALVNYLALIGWSPRDATEVVDGASEQSELFPAHELARRFSLSAVTHSAGAFDEEKLAWANRHYLKIAEPARLAELSLPFFHNAGISIASAPEAMEFLASVIPIATSVVSRLDEVPSRLAFLFNYSVEQALEHDDLRHEMLADGPRAVAVALARELADEPRLDRERFRHVANRVKVATGQKGRALFHPIRVILTGRAEGPELDLAVPAIDRGADLAPGSGLPRITGCRERAADFSKALG